MAKKNDILIVCATKSEYKTIVKVFNLNPNCRISGLYTENGTVGEYQIFCVYAGVGIENSIFCLNKFLQNLKPKIVINFGAAGSIRAQIRPGTLVIPVNIVRINNLQCTETIEYQSCFDVKSEIARVKTGTVDSFINNKKKKAKLIGESIDTIDCESYAIAKFCIHNSIEYFILRCITDNAGPFALVQYYLNEKWVLKKGANMLFHILSEDNRIL